MKNILSLAMIKMEKNFIAHLEKNYQRHPYEDWPILNRDDPWKSLIGFVEREMEELKLAVDILEAHKRTREKGFEIPDDRMIKEQTYNSMLEVGDVSNTLDYLFEALLKLYNRIEG